MMGRKRTVTPLWLLVLPVLLVLPALSMAGCARPDARNVALAGRTTATPAQASSGNAIVSLPVEDAPQMAAPRLSASLGVEAVYPPERLELPAIDVDTDVVEIGWHIVEKDGRRYSEWDVADYAAGWHRNSALPGRQGNVVMSGHNNIKGATFRDLDMLKEGDVAHVWAGGRRYSYRVSRVMIVPEKFAPPEQRAENARWIGAFDDERLTLVSCWPRNDNTHRVIVVAYPVQE